jgi:hypothetical protein
MLLKREEDFLFDEKANKADFCWTCWKFKKKRKSKKKLLLLLLHSFTCFVARKAATMTREQRLSFSLLK